MAHSYKNQISRSLPVITWVAVIIVLLSSVHPATGQAQTTGQWTTLPYPMPINPIHAALMHNGKVLIVAGSGNYPANLTNGILKAAIWDPGAGTVSVQNVSWDMFCNGMVGLSDGREFIFGGTAGAQIGGNVLTWTPTHAQSRASNAFEVRATTAAGGSASQEFSVTPRGTVRGTALDSYTSLSGTVTVPQDLTTMYIAAVVLTNGQWTTFQANTNSSGSFDIPGVPAGNYFLVTPAGAYWTAASDVDLGENHLGRPDALWPQAATFFAVDFTGLNAWKDDDYLWFVNPNLGQTFMWSAASADDQIATFTRTWTGPLSNSAKGDQWYVSQVVTKEVSGSEFEYLRKAAPVLSVTQADGSTVSLAGTMADITQASLPLKILGSQFAAQTFSIHSDGQPHSTEIELDVQPFTATNGAIGPTLLLKNRDPYPIVTDLDYGTVGYGNPYPSTWTPVLNVEYEVNVSYTASGAATPVEAPGEVFVSTVQMPAAGSGVGPIIGPVQNIKLEGLALTQPQTVGSPMPTITWDAPLLGTPTVYQLTIYQLFNSGGESQYENVLDIYTSDRSLNLPDGTLANGSEYFFAIRAYYLPGVDLTTSPHRRAFPMAYADALTAIVSIPVSGTTEKLESALTLSKSVN